VHFFGILINIDVFCFGLLKASSRNEKHFDVKVALRSLENEAKRCKNLHDCNRRCVWL